MTRIFFLLLLVSFSAQAFTLNNNFEAAFDQDVVKVSVDENTNCPTNRITVAELAGLIKPAIDDFWNTVPTSSLRLKSGGFSSTIDNINSPEGVLCPPTDDECIESAGNDLIPPVKDIVIACNSNLENFGADNVLAVTVPNNFSGKKIKGAVILINDNSDDFSKLSRSDRIGVIAHEIGHAIGLGHAKDKSALMYYRTVEQRKRLGDDDINGVSYLYPVHVDGCGAFGGLFGGTTGTGTKSDPPKFPFWPMAATLTAMIGIFEVTKAARRWRRLNLRLSVLLNLFRA